MSIKQTTAMVVYDDLSEEFRLCDDVVDATHELESRHPDYLIDGFDMEWRTITTSEAIDLLPENVAVSCRDNHFIAGLQVYRICRGIFGIPFELTQCDLSEEWEMRVLALVPQWRENSPDNYAKCRETGFIDPTPYFERQMEIRNSELSGLNVVYQTQMQRELQAII